MGIGVVIVAISGWLGGTLVYRNQIGVDRRYASAGKFKTRTIESWSKPVCNQSELGDGQMMLVVVDKERIVVGRCSEGFFAFSDHCTHKGGPLSDGALVGCTVQCPWHGSQFDINTGRVVAGPAQEKIDVYSIKISDGEIYVQPPLKPTKAEPTKAA
jgi:nitrite reductase/ring-hydroxylating ferredoxin subunit